MDLKNLPLNLADLKPQDAVFKLDNVPVELTLRRWSLLAKDWAMKRFGGPKELQRIITEQDLIAIAELCFFLLKDESKKHFLDANGTPSRDEFFEKICSLQDQLSVQTALLKTIGIGEPEFEKIAQSIAPGENPEAPKP